MNTHLTTLLLALVFACLTGAFARAQSPEPVPVPVPDVRVTKIEKQLADVEHKMKTSHADTAGAGGVAFLFGAFCALWAQNSGRSAWLWFFLGLIFSVITVVFLLIKNSDDRFDKQQRDKYTHGRA